MASPLERDQAVVQRKTVRVKSITENVFLVTSFIEAFVRSSVEGEALFFFETYAGLSVKRALQTYHLQVAILYFGQLCSFLTKMIPFVSSYWMLVLFTVTQVVGLFIFDLCLIFLSPNQTEKLRPLWLTYSIIGPFSFGCKYGQMRQAMSRQYNFPREMDEYMGQLWHMHFAGTMGRLFGFVNMWTWRDGPKVNFVKTILVSTVFLVIDIVTLLFGSFFIRKPSRHRRGTVRSETSEKRMTHSQHAISTWQSRDGLKKRFPWALIKHLLPLYLPIILLMQYRFQRSSRFIQQAKELDLRVTSKYWLHPIFLNVFYPLTVLLMIYPYRSLCNVLKKRRLSFTTFHKTMMIFFFMVLSMAAATLVAVFVDDRAGSEIRFRGGAVVVYNALECPAMVKTTVHPNVILGPISHVSLFSTEHEEITRDDGQTMRVEVDCKPYRSKLSIKLNVKETKIQEYLLAGSPKADEAVLIYLGSRSINMEFFFNNYIKLVHYSRTIAFNVSIDKSGQIGGSQFYHLLPGYSQSSLELIKGDRYAITANGMLLNEIGLEFGTSITVLIAESIKRKNIPLSRVAVLKHPNRIPFFYQFPQIIFQGLADVVMEAPGYIYASNLVSPEWRDHLQFAWFLSIMLAQLLSILYMEVFESERQVYNFIVGFCVCYLSMMYYWEIMKRVYKTVYERGSTPTGAIPFEDALGPSSDHIKTN